MLHTNRRFLVTHVATLDDLALKLANHSWTLCTGFRYRSLLLVNDATSEDGAQEFAVFRIADRLAEIQVPPGRYRQIESLTISWMEEPQIRSCLQALADGGGVDCGVHLVHADHGLDACRFCA